MTASELKRNLRVFRRWMAIWTGAFLPLGLWLIWYYAQPSPSLGIGWIQRPTLTDTTDTLWNLISGYGGVVSSSAFLFGAVALGLVAMGTIRGQDARIGNLTLWFGLIMPVVGVWVLSQRRPVYMDRYFIVLLPFVVYLVASGADWLCRWLTKMLGNPARMILFWCIFAIFAVTGPLAGWQVHTDVKYSREDWRGLVTYLEAHGEANPELWFSEPEASFPMAYYYQGDLTAAASGLQPLKCRTPCWWVIRQPYTDTHAFSQAISSPGREYLPELPSGCRILDRWDSPTGVRLWEVICDE